MEEKNRFKLARTTYNHHGSESVKTVSEATGITKSLIDDLESGIPETKTLKKRGVSYVTVAKLAKYYGVSADYLVGLSDFPRIDDKARAAYEYTGLSDKAISRLHELSEYINAHPTGFVPNPYDVLLAFDGPVQGHLPDGKEVRASEVFRVSLTDYLHSRIREASPETIGAIDDEAHEQLFSLNEQLLTMGYTVVPVQEVSDSILQRACDALKDLFREYGNNMEGV